MNKETDLQKIKEMAMNFVNLPIEEIDGFPKEILVAHPFYQSATFYLGNRVLNICEDENARKECDQFWEQQIENSTKAERIFYIIRKPYMLTFFKYVEGYLSLKDFSEILPIIWTLSEDPNNDTNCSLALIKKWFAKADKKVLMSKDDYEYYQQLPDVITIYRGVSTGRNPKGLSWTDDYNKAEWFANRFGKGYVFRGTIEKNTFLHILTVEKKKS